MSKACAACCAFLLLYLFFFYFYFFQHFFLFSSECFMKLFFLRLFFWSFSLLVGGTAVLRCCLGLVLRGSACCSCRSLSTDHYPHLTLSVKCGKEAIMDAEVQSWRRKKYREQHSDADRKAVMLPGFNTPGISRLLCSSLRLTWLLPTSTIAFVDAEVERRGEVWEVPGEEIQAVSSLSHHGEVTYK